MLDGTKGMEIAAVLGRTGVGKTTTIDFCCGARIVRINMSDEDEYGETVLEVDATESEQYLKIGHLGSMTKNIELLSSPRKKKAGQMLFCGTNMFSIFFARYRFNISILQTCQVLVMIMPLTKF